MALKLDAAFEQAKKQGKARQFLKNHPVYAARRAERQDVNYTVPESVMNKVQAKTGQVPVQTDLGDAIPGKVGKALKREQTVQDVQAGKQLGYFNPNVQTAFGSVTTDIDPTTGEVSRVESLTPEQQAILQAGQGITQTGQGIAQNYLQNYQPFQFGAGGDEARQRIEDQVYQRLTRDFSTDKERQRQATLQELSNRGIPLVPGDPTYDRFMSDFERQWRDKEEQARGQAVQMGGQEMQRSFGMGLQEYQQGLSDITQFQGMGTGLIAPNLPGYQAPGYQLTNPTEIALAIEQLKQGNRGLNIEQQRANLAGRTSGGYTPPAPAPVDPFVNAYPPEYQG